MATAKPIPDGARTVIPSLTVARCAEALAFYQRALGAELRMSMPAPDGTSVWHAELVVGDSVLFLNDELPGMSPRPPTHAQPSPVSFWINVKDCDAAFERAVEQGCTARMAPADMFWGDRTGTVADPFGFAWTFSTHVKDMTPDELAKAGEAFARQAELKA